MDAQTEFVRHAAKQIRRPRVLLAEDDADVRRFVAFTLDQDGYEVIEVADGFDLLDSIASQTLADGAIDAYDLLVSDVRLPGYTAVDILSVVRRALSNTPVVLMTAHSDPALLERARQLGVSSVFTKPFPLNEFRARVKALLAQTGSVHA